MKIRMFFTIAIFITLSIVKFSDAEMMSIGAPVNSLVERSSIFGLVSPNLGYEKDEAAKGLTYCMISFKNVAKMSFICTNKFNSEMAKKAGNKIAEYINKHEHIDISKMLFEAGLSGCKEQEQVP